MGIVDACGCFDLAYKLVVSGTCGMVTESRSPFSTDMHFKKSAMNFVPSEGASGFTF